MKHFLGYSLAGALTVGASVVPMLMFSGLMFQHAGVYAYLLPLVLLIVTEKSFIFLAKGFGEITNPTKIALLDLALAIAGTIVAMFGARFAPLWSVGAALVGTGMSLYAPMFRTFRDAKRTAGTWESNPAIIGSYLFLVVLLVVVFLLRRADFVLIMGIYLALLVITFVFLWGKFKQQPDRKKPMFSREGRSARSLVSTVVVAAATLGVCFYEWTADTRYAFWILAAYSVLFIVFAALHRERYHDYSKRTFWYGMMRTFMSTFGLIYFTATAQYDYVTLVFAMYGLGIGLSKVVGKPVKKLVGDSRYELVCIVLALGFACLLLTFQPPVMLAGILLSVMFSSAGNSNSAHIYLDDDAFPFNQRHLIRTRFFATGAILSQAVLMIALFAVTEAMNMTGSATLAAFTYSQGNAAAYAPVFAWALPICLAVFAVGAVIALRKPAR